jgi:hypothetical protein
MSSKYFQLGNSTEKILLSNDFKAAITTEDNLNIHVNGITMILNVLTLTAQRTTKHAKINVNELVATANLTLSLTLCRS